MAKPSKPIVPVCTETAQDDELLYALAEIFEARQDLFDYFVFDPGDEFEYWKGETW